MSIRASCKAMQLRRLTDEMALTDDDRDIDFTAAGLDVAIAVRESMLTFGRPNATYNSGGVVIVVQHALDVPLF